MLSLRPFEEMKKRRWFHLHFGATPATIDSVLEHGLERTYSNYEGFWTSRPEHTYIGTLERVKDVWGLDKHGGLAGSNTELGEWALFAVDLGELHPLRVNPDEDHLGIQSPTGGLDVIQRFRLPVPPSKWAWDWAKYLGIRPPASGGEWAEQIKLVDEAPTLHSVEKGSFAYHGIVPPAALSLVKASIELPA